MHLLIQGILSANIGIEFKETSSAVYVTHTVNGGIADKAGIKVGDIIIAINGHEPKTVQEAMGMLGHISIGDDLDLKIRRGEQDQEIKFAAK